MAEWVLIGADGMLGRSWEELLQARGVEHVATTIEDLDITDASAVAKVVTPGVKWVVNCAAYTLVDAAEEHEALANEVNGHAVGRMAERCKAVGAKLLHYSTDYVFDGTATEPYRTDHPRSPVNAYGRSKALGEELLEQSGVEHLLVRGSWLYAPWGQNFVLTMRDLAKSRDRLRVVDDQRGRPTDSRHLAEVSLGGSPSWTSRHLPRHRRRRVHLVRAGVVGGRDRQPGLRRRAVHERGIPARPAPRPAYSVLDVSATEEMSGH